jgi:CDP-glycerol glycerophosphotransferase
MPSVAQRGVREGWRRVRPYAKQAFYSRLASPLVSIVIPVYNVERYLPACLDSVLSQSYRHLQVILVDDGSPDSSIEIMRAYAARDRRITIVRQANAGLGAARNTGARHAKGRFLMFMDSDDELRPDAISTYVRTLRRTGSDFAVGCYDRMTSHQTWPAAWWIRTAHRFSRLGTTIAESPDAVVNAVAWSKVYRRSFWERHGFAFPEGVLYEDQALSARAYAKAEKFDILSKVTYGWRVREDRSSITQQATALTDLRARLRAAENSLAELDGPGLEHVRDTRLAQYLSNDFPLSIRSAQRADDEFWELLTDGLRRLTERAGDDVWAAVSAQHRVAIKLVTEGHREAAIDYVGLGHNNPKNIPPLVANGHVYLQTPAREILGLGPRDPLLALADHQLGLITSIQHVAWDSDHRLRVDGWAYIDNLDLSQVDPADIAITLTAQEAGTGARAELDITLRPSVEVTRKSKHRYANYERSHFEAVFDVPAALAALGSAPDRLADADRRTSWPLTVSVSAGGITRSGLLRAVEPGSSASRLGADLLPDGRLATAVYSGRDGLRVQVTRPRCTVTDVTVSGRRLTARLTGHAGFIPYEVQLARQGSTASQGSTVSQGSTALQESTVLSAPVQAGRIDLLVPETPPLPGATTGLELMVVASDGTRALPIWSPDSASTDTAGTGSAQSTVPAAWRARNGALVILDQPTLVLDDAEVVEDGLRLTGRLIAEHRTGTEGGSVRISLRAPRLSTEVGIEPATDGSFTVIVPTVADPWGLGALPLPSGDYAVTASAGEPGKDSPEIPVRIGDALLHRLPETFRTSRLFGRLLLQQPHGLAIRLQPPLADAESGARQQQRLQDRLAARLHDPAHEPGAVLLRSYYGEICGCNPAALQARLHSHGAPGGPYTSYFAIKDYSVHVPEGAVPVLHESAEWYRLLHDAVLYMDNMHQPLYHKKPAHQTQIQTFHGYPFKQMGLSHWAMQNRDVAHVRSYLDRAADWDYLVSPASYGSQALAREFGFPNTVLEIGYPRNDILLSPDADEIARQVRDRLGIAGGRTAVLYGPTFRDSMSTDDNTAAMVDFLDVDKLARELGDDFVIMVRGHAFNARLEARIGSRGTIIDVTDYPDIAELCLASDAAILDYSSLRFDYGLTGKPMIFMVPDLVQYQTEARGSLWDYGPTAPGPKLSTTDEVIAALGDLDRVRHDHAQAYAAFRRDFLDLDDGHATERLVAAVFPLSR